MERIAILLNDRSYEYDIYTLVIAFFQGVRTQVSDPGSLSPDGADLVIEAWVLPEHLSLSIRSSSSRMIPVPPGADRSVVKNLIKRNLYEMLRELTGRDLPWGNLTGIRPVKLAMQLVEEQEPEISRRLPEQASDSGCRLPEQENGSSPGMRGIVPDARRRMQERYYVSPGKADLAVRIAERERRILRGIDTKNGYSLYIGIPFCPSICLYCSFSSSPISLWKTRVDEYLDALIWEMRSCRDFFHGKILHTVYIGGGTPVTLEAEQLERLLGAVEENFDLSRLMEYTVEAGRPDSITRQKLEVLRKHPVTRISVNPQTMNQKTLDLIGRRHTVEDTVRAFDMARELGFDNINMDLIVGLPGEGLEEVEYTMQRIEALNPDDVTVHALALKRAARLALHMDEYEKISFHASDRIMERCEEGCERLGMTPYYLYRQKNMAGNFENVGYARPGKAGIYNILIMEEVECILALGASGSTKIVYEDGRIERIENVKDIRNYLERIDEMIDRKMKEVPGNG